PVTPALEPPPAESVTVVAATPPRPRHAGLRKVGIVLVAVGGVSVVLGATFIGLAVEANGTIANPPPGWVYDPGLDGRRGTMLPAGITLGVVGAASVVAGAVLTARR